MAQALIFLAIALSVVGLIHYYLWRRLVRGPARGRRARRLGTIALVVAPVLVISTFLADRALPRPAAQAVAWVGYLWLAVMFYLLVFLVALELPALAVRIVLRRGERLRAAAPVAAFAGLPVLFDSGTDQPGTDQPGTDQPGTDQPGIGAVSAGSLRAPAGGVSRRLVLARAVAVTAGVAAVGVVGSGVGMALGPPRVNRIQIPLAKLPRTADGLRVALVSDIHLGPLQGIAHTRRVVDLVNGLDPDLVALVGDLVDGSVADLGPAAAPLRDLRSRYGSFFVTGNHEYFSGHEEWLAEITRLGLRPLRNERVEVPGGLDLAGVNDPTGSSYSDGPDLDRALAGRDPGRPVVLLAHQPFVAHDAAARGVDLQLSGHTHGGQMVPFDLLVRLAQQPVVSGLGRVDGMPVYVTNGAGFWGPPVRVGAPPDITLVRLRAG